MRCGAGPVTRRERFEGGIKAMTIVTSIFQLPDELFLINADADLYNLGRYIRLEIILFSMYICICFLFYISKYVNSSLRYINVVIKCNNNHKKCTCCLCTQLQHIYNNYYKLISSTAAGTQLVGYLNSLALFLFLIREVQSHNVKYTEKIQPI